MDLTLRTYLELADTIHFNISNNNSILYQNQVKIQLENLENYIRQIQTVSYKIATIYNACRRVIKTQFIPEHKEMIQISSPAQIVTSRKKHKKKKRHRKDPPSIIQSPVKPPASSEDPLLLENQDEFLYSLKHPGLTKEVAPGIHINVSEVSSVDEIPNASMYWVSSTEQFCIKINGTLFKGNIGDIFTKFDNKSYTEKCYRNNNCKTSICKYYHQPNTRNWMNSSWLYTSEPLHQNNIGMRHFGNRSTLDMDVQILKKSLRWSDITEKYKDQTIHDILVSLCI